MPAAAKPRAAATPRPIRAGQSAANLRVGEAPHVNAVACQRVGDFAGACVRDEPKQVGAPHRGKAVRREQRIDPEAVLFQPGARVLDPLRIAKRCRADRERRSRHGPGPELVPQALRMLCMRHSEAQAHAGQPISLSERTQHDRGRRQSRHDADIRRGKIGEGLIDDQQAVALRQVIRQTGKDRAPQRCVRWDCRD